MGMQINDYTATIKINSTELKDWSGFSVTTRLGQAETQFSVDLQRPINISEGDTISISDGFEGTEIALIEDKVIENHSGSTITRALSGGGSTITRKGPTKDLYFINKTWLEEVAPQHVYENKIIYYTDPDTFPFKIRGSSVARLVIPPLPDKGIRDHEFECELQAGITHHDIARYVAQKCDLDVVINVPDLPVQKGFVLYSSERWWSAFPKLFNKWRPQMFVKKDVLYILDAGHDNQAKPSDNHLSFTEDSFSVLNWGVKNQENEVDHVVIQGPSERYTYSSRSLTVARKARSAKDLAGSIITEQTEDTRDSEEDDLLEKIHNLTTNSERPVRTVQTTKKKVDPLDPNNRVTIEEKIQQYNSNDDELSRSITEFKFADFKTPVGSYTEQWVRAIDVGADYTETLDATNQIKQMLPSWSFQKVLERDIVYLDYYDEIGAFEIDDVTRELCVRLKIEETIEGTTYYSYDYVQPIGRAMASNFQIGDEDWETGWYTTVRDRIRYDKASSTHLRKTRIRTTMVPSRVTNIHTEDIAIPYKRTSGIFERRWEYFKISGQPVLYEEDDTFPTGEFHPKIPLSDPDIITESVAKQVAKRLMASSPAVNTFGTVKTTLPILGIMVGGTITLPACTKKYFDWTTKTWTEVTMASKTYWIMGHTRVCRYSGDPSRPNRKLEIYDQLEIQEYY
jgi:hypothetical protein